VLPLLERYAELRYGPPAPEKRAQEIAEFSRAVARLSLSLERGIRPGPGP
jgi:hypothetical protein